MSLLGGFDIIAQLSESAIGRIVSYLHRQRFIEHRDSWHFEGRRIELVFSSPRLRLMDDAGSDRRWGLAEVRATILFHSRPLEDPEGPAETAVVELTSYARFGLSTGNPGRLLPLARAIVQYDASHSPAAEVRGPAQDPDSVRRAVLDWATHVGNWWSLPEAQFAGETIESAGVRVVEASPATVGAVGLNLGSQLKGIVADLTDVVVTGDWAVALSEDLIVGEIEEVLDRDYPVPYRLDRRCTIRTFWGSCWNWATTRLMSRTVSLVNGFLKVTGQIKVANSGFLIPDLWADFTVKLTLSLGPSGEITAETDTVEVVITDPVWSFINALVGDELVIQMEAAIRDAVGTVGNVGLASLFDDQLLNELIRRGAPGSRDIHVETTGLSVRSDALVLYGNLSGIDVPLSPVAAFAVIERDDPRVKVFNAAASWARGATIVEYRWDFGDGSTISLSGDQRRFVEKYTYTSLRGYLDRDGCLEVSLTVKDSAGRQSTARRSVSFPLAASDNLLLFSSTIR